MEAPKENIVTVITASASTDLVNLAMEAATKSLKNRLIIAIMLDMLTEY